MNCKTLLAASLFAMTAGTAFAESGFLHDYSILKPMPNQGNDRGYIAPDGFKRMAAYKAVMVDQAEIHFDAHSEYRGLKPEDIQALASLMREAIQERLTAGGYRVVEQPAADAIYLRMALTDLYLKKKKRKLLQYTPVGAVAKAGTDVLKETLDKVDIIEMAFEAELADSRSGELLAAIVVKRGAPEGGKEQRMDREEFRATIREYADRLRCRLDNSRVPESQWINCLDPQARQLRQGPR